MPGAMAWKPLVIDVLVLTQPDDWVAKLEEPPRPFFSWSNLNFTKPLISLP